PALRLAYQPHYRPAPNRRSQASRFRRQIPRVPVRTRRRSSLTALAVSHSCRALEARVSRASRSRSRAAILGPSIDIERGGWAGVEPPRPPPLPEAVAVRLQLQPDRPLPRQIIVAIELDGIDIVAGAHAAGDRQTLVGPQVPDLVEAAAGHVGDPPGAG